MSTHKYFFPSFSVSDPWVDKPLSLSSSPTVITPFISMSEEYEKMTKINGKIENLMTQLTGEITGNNWILKF